MIKLLLLSFIFLSSVHANDVGLASSILYKVTQELTKRKNPKIYLHHKEKIKFPFDYSQFDIVKDCKQADIVLLSTMKNLQKPCKRKILFATNKTALKNRYVLGAFFWQKGRPNIILYKKRLNQKRLKLSSSFNKYIE